MFVLILFNNIFAQVKEATIMMTINKVTFYNTDKLLFAQTVRQNFEF